MQKIFKITGSDSGKLRTYALFWLLGVPVPVLFLIFLFRGCH